MSKARVPTSTYRLQLHAGCNFLQVAVKSAEQDLPLGEVFEQLLAALADPRTRERIRC